MAIKIILGSVECNLNKHTCYGVIHKTIDITQTSFDDLILTLGSYYFKLADPNTTKEYNAYIESNWESLMENIYWQYNKPYIFSNDAEKWHCCDNGYFHSVENSIRNLKRDLWGRESFAASSL